MLQRFNFALFSKGPPVTNHESLGGQRGGERGGFHPARWRFLPWGPQQKTFLSRSPGKGKGEVFTLRLPYSCSQRPKKRELSPATSTASCSGPLEPDTGIFPGGPIGGIQTSPPSVLAGICAGPKACNKGPERSCIEFVGPEKTRRRSNLRRRSYRFSAKGGNCL